MDPRPEDTRLLRRAIALAVEAREAGDGPFGAVLVDTAGAILAEGRNTVASTQDVSAHAETVALRDAGARHGIDALAGSTMYASGEPCAMCAAAMVYAGVRRVVYGLPAPEAGRRLPADTPKLSLRCADVMAASGLPVSVEGPVLEDEAAAAFGPDPAS